MFLHGGFTHLLFNMFTLYFLGPETERAMGSKHFLAMYLLSGLLEVSPHLLPAVREVLTIEGSVNSRVGTGGTARVRVDEQLARLAESIAELR